MHRDSTFPKFSTHFHCFASHELNSVLTLNFCPEDVWFLRTIVAVGLRKMTSHVVDDSFVFPSNKNRKKERKEQFSRVRRNLRLTAHSRFQLLLHIRHPFQKTFISKCFIVLTQLSDNELWNKLVARRINCY